VQLYQTFRILLGDLGYTPQSVHFLDSIFIFIYYNFKLFLIS
jgi:hypothetical protein